MHILGRVIKFDSDVITLNMHVIAFSLSLNIIIQLYFFSNNLSRNNQYIHLNRNSM